MGTRVTARCRRAGADHVAAARRLRLGAGPALRDQRLRRLPQHPAARAGKDRQRRRAGSFQGGRPLDDARALRRPARHVRGPRLRHPRALDAARSTTSSRTAASASSPADVERTYSPRPGADRRPRLGFGVPHVYGRPAATSCSAPATSAPRTASSSWTSLRHAGPRPALGVRRRLEQGDGRRAVGRRSLHRGRTCSARSTSPTRSTAPRASSSSRTSTNYVAGINQYITEAHSTRPSCPASTRRSASRSDHLEGHRRDRHRLAGRRHLRQGRRRRARQRRGLQRGARRASARSRASRSGRTSARPTTPRRRPPCTGRTSPTRSATRRRPERGRDPRSAARWSTGSPDDAGRPSRRRPARAGTARRRCGGLDGGSNALLVSGAESESGHPLAVFGPQVAYFAPQILMEEDLHGPDFDARGAAFVGVNLYVLLGRGQDYAWSATSAGQDIIDTFAEKLCEPDGGDADDQLDALPLEGPVPPDRGARAAINVITPNPGDPEPARGLHASRPSARSTASSASAGTVDGDPGRLRELRSTYFHEADSARGFSRLQHRPPRSRTLEDFQQVCRQDQLHLQLVLHRRPRHRLLQLGQQPGARRRAPTPSSRPGAPASGTGRAGTR